MKITDIARNDIAACVAYHDEHDGVTSDEAHVLIMLQSDPAELIAIMKRWKRLEPKVDRVSLTDRS